MEHKEQLISDLDDKKEELVKLEAELVEINEKIEQNDMKTKFFRKEEITELISAVDKLDGNNENANEFNIKKEKLQTELTIIEEELFEMEKKGWKPAEEDEVNEEMEESSSEHSHESSDSKE